jgi:hypothetical protein
MAASQYFRTSDAANDYRMLKMMTLERTIVATQEYASTIFIASTSETKPVISLSDFQCSPMVGASYRQTAIQVKPALRLHKGNDRGPKHIAPNAYIACLGRC